MYSYEWDSETGGFLLNSSPLTFSKEPRPVYYKELDILGFDKYWKYDKQDDCPYMWAEANNYWYRGKHVAKTKGGSLYKAPELIILDEPEANLSPLRCVDIQVMVEKNYDIIESLAQETIRKIYNTFAEYREKVDVFHVSYSGGKDSEVTLDLVQQALPHNAFVVLFGDTGMEFPDTYLAVNEANKFCEENDISFYIAKSDFDPLESWRKFGFPSSALRWCCGVQKTAPQLIKLREITVKSDLKEMAFVGVRASESVRRSGYDYLSLGTKHGGQFSFNPILEWNSAEIYLYMYSRNLYINGAYKKGSGRAGCLYCPMATGKSDFINYSNYSEYINPFIDIIKDLYVDGKKDNSFTKSYIDNKGWKARKNGRDLTIGVGDFNEKTINNSRIITMKNRSDVWKEWIKTVGRLSIVNGEYCLQLNCEKIFQFVVNELENEYIEFIFDDSIAKKETTNFKNIKNALKKSHFCLACRYCEANCPFGNISFDNGKVSISSNCINCGLCSKIENGCLVYNSLILPKGTGKMKKGSIDEYGTHPVKLNWLKEFINYKEEFESKHSLGSAMIPMFRKFLRNSGIVDTKNNWNVFTDLLFRDELDNDYIWGIMYSNLAYSSQFSWAIKNLSFDIEYSQNELKNMLSDYVTSKTGPSNITNSYKHFAELPFSRLGFGKITCKDKLTGKDKEGFIYSRSSWHNPDSRVILYSLYKFAEACEDYYQFTLSRLLDHSIDSNGISPTEIFGLGRNEMEKILNGLTVNYPDFIHASFTLGLDNITLRDEKTSNDVLALF